MEEHGRLEALRWAMGDVLGLYQRSHCRELCRGALLGDLFLRDRGVAEAVRGALGQGGDAFRQCLLTARLAKPNA